MRGKTDGKKVRIHLREIKIAGIAIAKTDSDIVGK